MTLINNKYYAIGKRKTSVANVTLTKGNGTFFVNKKRFSEYFSGISEEFHNINLPFLIANLSNEYNTNISVKGGGISGQLSAITLGIAKAVCLIKKDYRPLLKKKNLLRRDDRIKERRKYGLKKARKASQYSKR